MFLLLYAVFLGFVTEINVPVRDFYRLYMPGGGVPRPGGIAVFPLLVKSYIRRLKQRLQVFASLSFAITHSWTATREQDRPWKFSYICLDRFGTQKLP